MPRAKTAFYLVGGGSPFTDWLEPELAYTVFIMCIETSCPFIYTLCTTLPAPYSFMGRISLKLARIF
jgi:hypothetical protein